MFSKFFDIMRSTIHILPFLIILLFACSVEENNGDDDDEKTSISVSSLENNSIVQDTVLIFCESNNDNIVFKIELWVDGDSTEVCDYSAPFILTWDTYKYDNGIHTLFIRLYDEEGNTVGWIVADLKTGKMHTGGLYDTVSRQLRFYRDMLLAINPNAPRVRAQGWYYAGHKV